MSSEVFDVARIVLCLVFFTYASWSDWKRREVSNRVWLIMAPLALALTSIQFIVYTPNLLQLFAVSFGITAGLSIALFYLGAFGGADAKALMCLALALPVYPNVLAKVFSFNASFMQIIFPLIVFTNGVLLAAFTVVYSILRNCVWKAHGNRSLFVGLEGESFGRKVLAFLTGYKVKVSALEKGHMYPLEDVNVKENGETERRLLIMPKDEKTEEIVKRVVAASKEGKIADEVWVTPGLPLLVFITIGFVIALVFGNLIWLFLRLTLVGL
jgi:preflagellin peptidase FlaK